MSDNPKQQITLDAAKTIYAELQKVNPVVLRYVSELQKDLIESRQTIMACIHRIDMLTDELAEARRKNEHDESLTQEREPERQTISGPPADCPLSDLPDAQRDGHPQGAYRDGT